MKQRRESKALENKIDRVRQKLSKNDIMKALQISSSHNTNWCNECPLTENAMCTSFKNKDMKSCGHLVTLYYLEMVAKEKGLKG